MANITGTVGRIAALVGLRRLWRDTREHGQTGRLIAFTALGVTAALVASIYSEHKPKGRQLSPKYPKLSA